MNLPNKLTLFRIILIPIFLVLMVVPLGLGSVVILGVMIPIAQILAALVFVVASLTDFLDGQIARRKHLVTNFGKFADPLADKMLVMCAFIVLVGIGEVPSWVAAVIVCRELAVTGLRLIIVEDNGTVAAAQWPGKIKTFFQMIAIIFLLLNNFLLDIGQICLYIGLFFTIYSGIEYFWKNRSVFADSF